MFLQSDPYLAALKLEYLDAKEPLPAVTHSYRHILKSTVWIGGYSFVAVAIGMVRSKAIALLLGPTGVGLLGLYSSVTDVVQTTAGLGINSSGVRQIAEAAGANDVERLRRTSAVLRRTSVLLGFLGAVFVIAFSRQISSITFGTEAHAQAIAILSIAILLRILYDGQSALIQGMRRIGDLAKINVQGALFSTIFGVAAVYFWGRNGVVMIPVVAAAASLFSAVWYSRKLSTGKVSLTASEVQREQSELLKLGSALMISGLMTTGAAYIIRISVLHQVGVEAAGWYQAAWAIGGVYVGFILQSMGADFYPRLTAVARNNPECNRTVNEQAHVSLLLIGPGIIATLTFASLVISLFYSADFRPAVDLLRWLCLGMALRVISWPMGFIILAKGSRRYFFLSELAWNVTYVSLAWICLQAFGLSGAGVAFFLSYVFYSVFVYAIVRKMSGFSWSQSNQKAAALILGSIGMVFLGCRLLAQFWGTMIGTLILLAVSFFSFRGFLKVISRDDLPQPVRLLLRRFRSEPPVPRT